MAKSLLAKKLDQIQTPLASIDRCNFLGCSSIRKSTELKFYPFPVHNDETCFKWILYSQNGELIGLSPEKLSKMTLCERHFDDDAFVDSSRKALLPHAIPFPLGTPLAAFEDLAEIQGHDPCSIEPRVDGSDTSVYHFNVKHPEIRAKIIKVQALLKENEALKVQLKPYTKFKFEFNSRKPSAQVLRNMQLYSKTHKMFSREEQLIALKYYLASTDVYSMLLNDDFILPSEDMIHTWVTMINLPTGINPSTMILLEKKAATMSAKEKQCVLQFNEMTLVPELFSDPDYIFIEGTEDLGELGKSDEYGDHALVLLAQGLYSDWKVPLSYYISHNLVPCKTLETIVVKQIEILQNTGFEVKAICCDQDNCKKQLYEALGITKEIPFFEVNSRPIMGLHDPSYLMRLIRKSLQEEDLVVTSQGRKVSWKDVIATFNLARESRVNHLVPAIAGRQFFNLELAYQEMFTQEFANAMRAAVRTRELQSETALHTAAFLSIITSVFVCLTTGGLPEAEETLRKGILFVDGIQADREKHPCFEALSQTMRGVLKLWYASREEYPVLETGRLTLQALDDVFSKIHDDLDYDEPSVRDFRDGLEQIKSGLFKLSLKTAECLDEDFMFGFNLGVKNCFYTCKLN